MLKSRITGTGFLSLRKERALAETAALLVLSKKLSAIFPEHAAV
jgi:hypothetical protein